MSARKTLLVLLVAVSAFIIGGCRTAMIYNVENAPIPAAESSDVSLQEVKAAIVRAGASLGWQMRPVEEGHIIGTLHLRKHMAQVDVTYDNDSYDIVYRDSENLDYRENGHIHSNYNGWIQNLDNAIQSQLSTLYL